MSCYREHLREYLWEKHLANSEIGAYDMPAIARVRDSIDKIENMKKSVCGMTGMTTTDFNNRANSILKDLKRVKEQLEIKKDSVIISKRSLECLQKDVRHLRTYVSDREGGRAVDGVSYYLTDIIHRSPEYCLESYRAPSSGDLRYSKEHMKKIIEDAGLRTKGDKMKIVKKCTEVIDLNQQIVDMIYCAPSERRIIIEDHRGKKYEVTIVALETSKPSEYIIKDGC